jgi:hypothetical protein
MATIAVATMMLSLLLVLLVIAGEPEYSPIKKDYDVILHRGMDLAFFNSIICILFILAGFFADAAFTDIYYEGCIGQGMSLQRGC